MGRTTGVAHLRTGHSGHDRALSSVGLSGTQQHQWKNCLIVPQWLIKIDPLAAAFTVRRAGDGENSESMRRSPRPWAKCIEASMSC